jgi:hypothetical protein
MNKPPLRVTLLLLLVLSLIIWNGLRLWTSLAWRDALNEFSARESPAVMAVSGATWIVVGIILFWAVWQRKAWSAKLLLGAAAVYTVWYWCERMVWQNPHPNWPFAVIVNLAALVFILFNIKPLSREAYERKSENQKAE